MRYSNRLVVDWLLQNIAGMVWLRTHSKRKDFHYTKDSTTAQHDVFGLFDGGFIDKYGNFVFIQIKTNAWPSEKQINDFLYQKNIHAIAFNVRKVKSKYQVFYRFYKYYIPFISEKEN